MQYPGFIGGTYVAQNPDVSLERTINLYTEYVPVAGAKARVHGLPTPGVEVHVELPASPFRGALALNNHLYVVSGDRYYEVFEDGTYTELGAVAFTDSLPVTISGSGDAGDEIMVCASNRLYIHTISTSDFAEVVSMAGKARMGAFLNSVFCALDTSTSTVWFSDVYDGLTWDGLQFRQRDATDRWVSMIVANEQLILTGEHTSDIYYFSGAYPIPVEKLSGAAMQHGNHAPWSIATVREGAAWLGQTRDGITGVLYGSGSNIQRISHQALDDFLSDAPSVSDAIGSVYEDRGHTFYLLTLPTARVTQCYDFTTEQWHERGTWIVADAEYEYWRPTFHAFVWKKHYFGDRESGTLYQASSDFGLDVDGRPIRRVRRAPSLHAEGRKVSYDYFELDLERGLGTASGQGFDPMAELRISDNGGKTWWSAGSRSTGRQGEFSKSVRWNRLGSSENRVFEVVFADPVPFRITNAYLGIGGMQ